MRKGLITFFSVVGLTLAMSVTAFADTGTVTATSLNLRSGPSTNDSIIGSLGNGASVTIIETVDSSWVKVKTAGGSVGYVSSQYLNINKDSVSSSSSTSSNDTGYVTADSLNIRSGASTNDSIIGSLANGDIVSITEVVNSSWVKIKTSNGTVGYVASQYLSIRSGGQASRSSVSRTGNSSVIEYAKKFLGTPYVYGGNGPNGFDCSGFVKYVYSNFGVNLSRTTYTQVNEGTYVEKSNLQTGDLVFFKNGGSVSHVGIYISNGQFIHASKPGDVVKITSLNDSYYIEHYHSARRVK